MSLHPTDLLSSEDATRVAELARAAETSDGVRPLNDEALLHLERDGARHWLLDAGGELAGYAQWQPDFGTAQVVVHPGHRRQGHGRTLVEAVLAAGAEGIWAFGRLPAAQALAAALALDETRGLLIMDRAIEPTPWPDAPAGVTLRRYTDADATALLAVNAAAFAEHPEQGDFSAADLAARQAEPWWDPAGLIVAEDAEGLVGFHWTKRHDAATGEVYVIGVHPRAHGRGLGTVLLQAGLAHLAEQGCARVLLYVEADNPAVRLYERSGFGVAHTDVLYGAPVAR